MAIPYRPATDPEGFAVHRPKFLGYEGEEPNFDEIAEEFFIGIEQHEHGAEIWNNYLDESR